MGKPSPPPPPNPTATIAAQTAANSAAALQNAELNRINQSTPWGTSNYTVIGHYPDGTPIYSQSTQLNPQFQNLLNLGTQGATSLAGVGLSQLGNIKNVLGQPINTSGLPQVTGTVTNKGPGLSSGISTAGVPSLQSGIGNGDYASQIQQAQNAAYNAQAQYLDPRFTNQQNEINNQLINEGVAPGSDAWNKAQQELSLQRNQAYQSAQDAAVQAGFGEQNTLFGQAATQAAFQNAANQQAFGQNTAQAQFQNQANQQGFGQGVSQADLQNAANAQAMQNLFALRNQPLNEYSALMSGTQVSMPNFQSYPTSAVPPTDVAGITNQGYQNQLGYYQAQQAANPMNALFSLGGSLGSAAILSSDRRLKRDIKRVGETPSGIPIYEFNYKDGCGPEGRYIGVMADEVRPIIPEAVIEDESGYLKVDYARLR